MRKHGISSESFTSSTPIRPMNPKDENMGASSEGFRGHRKASGGSILSLRRFESETLRIPPRNSLRLGTARRGRVLPHPLPLGSTAHKASAFPGTFHVEHFSPKREDSAHPPSDGARTFPGAFPEGRNRHRKGRAEGVSGNASQKRIRTPRATPSPTMPEATTKVSQTFSDRACARLFDSLSKKR